MTTPTTNMQKIARIVLGIFMLLAGIGHLSFQREAFQAQVPDGLPFSKDFVVVASGVVEILLGLAMLCLKRFRVQTGIALAVFFLLIFPGNIAQYMHGRNAFGLDTDNKRLIRLFFQPLLMVWALWSTGAINWLRNRSH